MNVIGEHLSKSFDKELQALVNEFLKMGGMAEENIANAVTALLEVDGAVAEQVIANDKTINKIEQSVDEMVIKILAKRQPAATDLRMIMAISKSNADLERIGDETKKIAKMARRSTLQGQAPIGYHEAQQMGGLVLQMLKLALEAFAKFDVEQAVQVLKMDDEVDAHYKSASRALMTYIMEDGRYVSRVIDVLWVLRSLERIGAHATNIAEQAIYCISGQDIRYQKSGKVKKALGLGTVKTEIPNSIVSTQSEIVEITSPNI